MKPIIICCAVVAARDPAYSMCFFPQWK